MSILLLEGDADGLADDEDYDSRPLQDLINEIAKVYLHTVQFCSDNYTFICHKNLLEFLWYVWHHLLNWSCFSEYYYWKPFSFPNFLQSYNDRGIFLFTRLFCMLATFFQEENVYLFIFNSNKMFYFHYPFLENECRRTCYWRR